MAAALLIACRREPPPPDGGELPDLRAPAVHAAGPGRCGECHGQIAEEWRGSAHARAGRAPLYLALRQRAGTIIDCAPCHGAQAGVDCDGCHTVQDVRVEGDAARVLRRPQDPIKFGPRCDVADHYFHKMGCSPLHEDGRFCAGCHHLVRRGPSGAAVPVFTEFDEWQEGVDGQRGLDCQGCHMPGQHRAVARGWPPRHGVGHHGLWGPGERLRQRALHLEVEEIAQLPGGAVQVRLAVTNAWAGHRVPAGLPGRQLVLRVRSERGGETDHAERRYERVLGDEDGRPAPFYAATRMVQDNRLMPRERRVESFVLRGGPGAEVIAELWYVEFSPALCQALGLPAMAERPVTSLRRRVR